jgi:hypothetical protein
MDRVQFSPSAVNKNSSEPATTKRSEQAVFATPGGPEAASGAPAAPTSESVKSDVAQNGPSSPMEKAQEQQRKLNNLTLAVRRAATETLDTQELIRESVGQFFEENSPMPAGSGSGEAYVPEIDMPGSGEIEVELAQPGESAPAPEVPKTEPPPTVKQDSGGGDADGPRGEVVDIVS